MIQEKCRLDSFELPTNTTGAVSMGLRVINTLEDPRQAETRLTEVQVSVEELQ